MVTVMVTKMIWRATIERMLIAMGLVFHVEAEQAKTAASQEGFIIRIAMKIKEALAAVYHGAVEAFSALASIPWIGPVLGAVAMAAALAGGIALVSKIGHKEGGYTANAPIDQPVGVVHGGEWVAPAWMVNDRRFQPMIATLEAARNGSSGLSIGGFFKSIFDPGIHGKGGFLDALSRGFTPKGVLPGWDKVMKHARFGYGDEDQRSATNSGPGSMVWNPSDSTWEPDSGQRYFNPSITPPAYAPSAGVGGAGSAAAGAAGAGGSGAAGASAQPIQMTMFVLTPDIKSQLASLAQSRNGRKFLVDLANGMTQEI
jgi:hypothetical protein